MIVSYLTYHRSGEKSVDSVFDQIAAAFGFAIAYPVLTIMVGWIVLQFL